MPRTSRSSPQKSAYSSAVATVTAATSIGFFGSRPLPQTHAIGTAAARTAFEIKMYATARA